VCNRGSAISVWNFLGSLRFPSNTQDAGNTEGKLKSITPCILTSRFMPWNLASSCKVESDCKSRNIDVVDHTEHKTFFICLKFSTGNLALEKEWDVRVQSWEDVHFGRAELKLAPFRPLYHSLELT